MTTATQKPAAAMPRTMRVEHCMGTVFSIDVRDCGDWEAPIADVVAWLHRVDATFSTYKRYSDISRMQRSELRLVDADPTVAQVLDLCAAIEPETRGHFTARVGRTIDPTGLVKGWAIDRAGALLAANGATNFAINGGGDVLLRGHASPGRDWRVGIVDPHDRSRLITAAVGHDLAVASSGVAERGDHIVDPYTGAPADTDLAAATVVGPSIVRADAYATAAFVMGSAAHAWITGIEGYELLTVSNDGDVVTSARWPDPDTA